MQKLTLFPLFLMAILSAGCSKGAPTAEERAKASEIHFKDYHLVEKHKADFKNPKF